MEGNRGVTLILALLVLSFLSILSGAFLTASTIDIWISDNYKTSTQSLYLAEAGIEDARELLRRSTRLPAELAGDEPLIPFRELIDGGHYTVWLHSTNATLTLVSLGQIRSAQKTIEAVIQKAGFPESDSDPRLKTPDRLDALAASIMRNATDIYDTQTLGDYGAPTNYGVAVVNGNADVGPGTSYGLLLVRGDLNVVANFTWNGLVVALGPIHWNGFTGTINGGFFADGVLSVTDVSEIRKANASFPYNPISIREK